jgi:hypothetical protein
MTPRILISTLIIFEGEVSFSISFQFSVAQGTVQAAEMAMRQFLGEHETYSRFIRSRRRHSMAICISDCGRNDVSYLIQGLGDTVAYVLDC